MTIKRIPCPSQYTIYTCSIRPYMNQSSFLPSVHPHSLPHPSLSTPLFSHTPPGLFPSIHIHRLDSPIHPSTHPPAIFYQSRELRGATSLQAPLNADETHSKKLLSLAQSSSALVQNPNLSSFWSSQAPYRDSKA